MSNKHTPGPWASNISEDFPEEVIDSNGRRVATCRWEDGSPFGGKTTTETEANAKLIAAAPELLEQLERVLPYLKATGTNGNHFVQDVEAAIKKTKQ